MKRYRLAKQQPFLRRGAASIDYVLTLGVLFTMSGFIVASGRRIMQLVYELTGFFLAWPFM
jgi:hypothetical protein